MIGFYFRVILNKYYVSIELQKKMSLYIFLSKFGKAEEGNSAINA